MTVMKAVQKVVSKHVGKSMTRLKDIQHYVQLIHSPGCYGDQLTPAQTRNIDWFENLMGSVVSMLPDEDFPDESDYLFDILLQCLRRNIPYNFQKHISKSEYAANIRPSGTPKNLEFVVVSLILTHQTCFNLG